MKCPHCNKEIKNVIKVEHPTEKEFAEMLSLQFDDCE